MKVSKRELTFSDQNGMILYLISTVFLMKMFSIKRATSLSSGPLLMITHKELNQLLVVMNKPS
jgi:hypothetical protein